MSNPKIKASASPGSPPTSKRAGRPGSTRGSASAAQAGNGTVATPTSQGATRQLLAQMTGLPERTVATWERRGAVAQDRVRKLRDALELLRGLARVMRTEFIPTWLQSPNQACGGRTPLELIRQGDHERIRRMIFFLESGVPS